MSGAERPPGEGWVEVTTWARLWSAVPENERVTESDIKRVWPGNTDHSKHYQDRLMARLRADHCEIASPQQDSRFSYKYLPCAGETYEGAARCPRHGGPKKPAAKGATTSELRAENERLKRQIRELGGSA